MSENWIAILPADPEYILDAMRRESALHYFWSIAPEADEIEVKLSDKLMFFDCGANLEKITCPHCGNDVPGEWWRDQMEEDYQEEFAKLTSSSCRAARDSRRWPSLYTVGRKVFQNLASMRGVRKLGFYQTRKEKCSRPFSKLRYA